MRQHTVDTPYMVGAVHYYSTELDGGIALFDAGPPTLEAEAHLQRSIDLRRLKYVFVTHCHADHYGLCNFITKNSPAKLFIPRLDVIRLKQHPERLAAIWGMLADYGFDSGFLDRLREFYAPNIIQPSDWDRFGIAEDSADLFMNLGITCLPCPGHSQSDLIYLIGYAAVTGDVLFRNLFQTPQLDIDLTTWSGRFRNYDAYCWSLLNLRHLRGLRILPGHHQAIGNVDHAILFYVRTLMRRASRLLPLQDLPLREIVQRIFQGRAPTPHIVFLKIGEVAFLLDFLNDPGLLKRSLEEIGLFDEVAEAYATVAGG